MKIISLLCIAAAFPISCCVAFSQSTANLPQVRAIFAAPMAQLQRSNLKKQLIQAAEAKDEPLIISLVEELALLNPTPIPTQGLMDPSSVSSAPLDGAWKLLFTNAKDAEAPARTEKNNNEKFGDEVAQGVKVKTGQRINAAEGKCINYIELSGDRDKRPFDRLEITIRMTPLSEKRVRLDFEKGRALNEKAPLSFLKDFRFNFPPPSFNDLVARVRGLNPSIEPQAYFDVLYIDNEIRAHRTGEGKIFVQKRDGH